MPDRLQVETELKGLKSQLAKKKGRLESLKSERAELDDQIFETNTKITILQKKIDDLQLNNKSIKITDAALIQYLRINGVDIEALKDEMLSERQSDSIHQLKNCKIKGNGHTLVVKNKSVVAAHVDKKKPRTTSVRKHQKGKPVYDDLVAQQQIDEITGRSTASSQEFGELDKDC